MKTNNDSFFVEPVDPQHEARAIPMEVVCRLFIWMAEGPTLEERGLRATVALYCVRPDLVVSPLEWEGETQTRTWGKPFPWKRNIRAGWGPQPLP